MILVTLGTRAFQFDRLLIKLDELHTKGIIREELIVQSVASAQIFSSFTPRPYFTPDEMNLYMLQSSLIITHGGTGTITDALKLGKKVIGVPRLSQYKEAIDDHQVELIDFFRKQGYIIGVNDVEELEWAIEKSKSFEPVKFVSGNERIKSIIQDFIDKF